MMNEEKIHLRIEDYLEEHKPVQKRYKQAYSTDVLLKYSVNSHGKFNG